jgi:hypothetical protein
LLIFFFRTLALGVGSFSFEQDGGRYTHLLVRQGRRFSWLTRWRGRGVGCVG